MPRILAPQKEEPDIMLGGPTPMMGMLRMPQAAMRGLFESLKSVLGNRMQDLTSRFGDDILASLLSDEHRKALGPIVGGSIGKGVRGFYTPEAEKLSKRASLIDPDLLEALGFSGLKPKGFLGVMEDNSALSTTLLHELTHATADESPEILGAIDQMFGKSDVFNFVGNLVKEMPDVFSKQKIPNIMNPYRHSSYDEMLSEALSRIVTGDFGRITPKMAGELEPLGVVSSSHIKNLVGGP